MKQQFVLQNQGTNGSSFSSQENKMNTNIAIFPYICSSVPVFPLIIPYLVWYFMQFLISFIIFSSTYVYE